MEKNFSQTGYKEEGRIYLHNDWYKGNIPSNVTIADNVYIDSSYGFSFFNSTDPQGLLLDEASGCYGQFSFIVSQKGKVIVGKFSILNGTTIVCKKQIIIGNHCMLAWGTVLTDSWLDINTRPLKTRQALLYEAAISPNRSFPFFGTASPIILEDNTWVGFGSVILPGVRLGRGCVVGCKTVISQDVPPYAVVAGSPARIVRYLNPDDTEEEKRKALFTHLGK
jgi:acetyltransferase-like isoleucine patch superfamily enzyme